MLGFLLSLHPLLLDGSIVAGSLSLARPAVVRHLLPSRWVLAGQAFHFNLAIVGLRAIIRCWLFLRLEVQSKHFYLVELRLHLFGQLEDPFGDRFRLLPRRRVDVWVEKLRKTHSRGRLSRGGLMTMHQYGFGARFGDQTYDAGLRWTSFCLGIVAVARL